MPEQHSPYLVSVALFLFINMANETLYLNNGSLPTNTPGVTCDFSDGPHEVPGWLVRHLGGEAAFSPDRRTQIRELPYQDFFDRWLKEFRAQPLRKLQTDIIRDHLRGLHG